MSRRLHDRLSALEAKRPSADGAEAHEKARAWCEAWREYLEQHHERGPKESWADVTARLWGFESTRAFRNWLRSPKEERIRAIEERIRTIREGEEPSRLKSAERESLTRFVEAWMGAGDHAIREGAG